ncbi:MAG: acyltransferase [Planctomycetota bacterium]
MGLLRFALAVAVLVHHSGPLFGWEATRLVGGPVAVQIFFMISGFYMSLVLRERYVGPGSTRRFWSNRWLRLVPCYFAVLVATIVGGVVIRYFAGEWPRPLSYWAVFGDQLSTRAAAGLLASHATIVGQDVVHFATFVPTDGDLHFTELVAGEVVPRTDVISSPTAGWLFLMLPQCWSLSLEILFYFIAPFVLRRPLLMAGLFIGSLGVRAALVSAGLTDDPWSYRFFPAELSLFLLGSYTERAWWRYKKTLGRARVFTTAVAIAYGALLVWPDSWPAATAGRWTEATLNLSPVCLASAGALPALFALTKSSPWDAKIALYSYPIYVLHHTVVTFAIYLVPDQFASAPGVLTLVPTLIGAALLVHGIEIPTDRYRRKRRPVTEVTKK